MMHSQNSIIRSVIISLYISSIIQNVIPQIENLSETSRTGDPPINPLKGRCPENEYWTNCTGCELRCDQDDNIPCSSVCNPPSCECRAFMGFRRDSNGICIRKEECPFESTPSSEQCTKLEEYNECGTACEETCANMGQAQECTKQCVPGCFCREDFVRERKGGCCIPRHLCNSTICGPNQEYQECGTACPETCAGKPEKCQPECVAGCFCKKDFVLDGTKCIPRDQCFDPEVKKCRENEEYQICGSACPETCMDNDTATCTLECVPGCFCINGYILEKQNGTCVKRETCKPPKYLKCPENEIFTYCGGCEGTCEEQFVPCTDICGSPGCECPAEKNFVRDDFGACIHVSSCKKNQ